VTDESHSKDEHQNITDDLSSITGGDTVKGQKKKKGMTKEEAMLGLKIKPA